MKPFEMRELDVRVRNLILSRRRLRERLSSPSTALRAGPLVEVRAVAAGVAPADQAYVARVRDAIQRGLADPDFGVGELADVVSQDRSHLFRRVKQLFGESPSDLIQRTDLRLVEAATVSGAVALAASYSPELLIVDESERDVLVTLQQLRAIVIVDDVPHGAPGVGTRLRLLARPFTAEGLVAEVGHVLG